MVKFKDNHKIVPGNNFKDDAYSFGKTLLEMLSLTIGSSFSWGIKQDIHRRYGSKIDYVIQSLLKEKQAERVDFIGLEESLKDTLFVSGESSTVIDLVED